MICFVALKNEKLVEFSRHISCFFILKGTRKDFFSVPLPDCLSLRNMVGNKGDLEKGRGVAPNMCCVQGLFIWRARGTWGASQEYPEV